MNTNKGLSSSNPNNSPPPNTPSPRRGGENLNFRTPQRPIAISGMSTPPRPPTPSVATMPLLHGPPGYGSHPCSSSSNPNNSPPPNTPSPRRGGENINFRTPQRPIAISRLPTPPRPPTPSVTPMALLHAPPGYGCHPSSFTYFPEGIAGPPAVPVGGSSGVGSGGSPSPGGSRKRGLGDGDERKKCSICGKEFATEKAVFGHMHLHKDRNWKGAYPPPTFNAQEEFADVPGVNLPQEEGGAGVRDAEAERLAEEEAAAAVERRRGIRIDLNVDLPKEGPAPEA